jgi:type IV secretion system protein VirD4
MSRLPELPELADGTPDQVAETVLDFIVGPRPGHPASGGAVEPAADDDGVLIADPSVIERAGIT